MPTLPKIIFDERNDHVALVGDCIVVVLGGTMTMHVVGAIERGLAELAKRGGSIGYVSTISPGMRAIESDVRERMASVVGRYSKQFVGAALICEGSGFRATVVRSVITAIHLASRAGHPLRVFDALPPALFWLKNRPQSEGIDTQAITDYLRTTNAIK